MRRAAVWVLHIGSCMDASLPEPLRLKEVPVVLNGGSGDGHGRERAKRLEEAFREAGVGPGVWPFGAGGGGGGGAFGGGGGRGGGKGLLGGGGPSRGSGHSGRAKRLEEAFREAGLEPRLWPFGPGEEGREVARRALEARPPVLVAAGGGGARGG